MNYDSVVQTIKNIEHIGSSPEVSLMVFEELKRTDFDMSRICELIAQEPTISAQVMKLANSPHFFRGNHVSCLSQAVLRIGVDNIKQILLAIELIGIFRGQRIYKHFDEKCFWKHTLAGALLSQEIAEKNDCCDAETCFLASLIRDISVLFLRQYFVAVFNQIIEHCHKHKVSFTVACEHFFNVDHRNISHLIGMRWNLPYAIYGALKGSDNTKTDKARVISDIILLSDLILTIYNYASWDTFYNPQIPDTLFQKYMLDMDIAHRLCSKVSSDVDILAEKIFFI